MHIRTLMSFNIRIFDPVFGTSYAMWLAVINYDKVIAPLIKGAKATLTKPLHAEAGASKI